MAPPVVLDNSRIAKMDDSLPLHFFWRETIMFVFDARWGIKLFGLLPWFLLISGLTGLDVSSKTRCDRFEIAFWIGYFNKKLLQTQ
jgi:hypothetical protein